MSARDDILRAVREARQATFGRGELPALPVLRARGAGAGAAADAANRGVAGGGAVWAGTRGRAQAGGPAGADGVADAIDARDALAERFTSAARAAAAQVEHATRAGVGALVTSWFPPAAQLLSTSRDVIGNVAPPDDPHALAALDVFVCEGVLGVAESGAIWLPASRLGVRAALVLAHDVVILLPRSAIVGDLHEAYATVEVSAEEFGVFLAGPSKTADIEQSLVIGAHGARGTRVVLLDE